MTEQELRQKVIAQAKSWEGLKEADGSFKPIIDIYNAIRPLPRGYHMTYNDPWCAAYVSAVGAQCGLTSVILPECSCDYMIALYKAKGRWAEADDYPAKPGDLIFYDWDDNGVGDNTGSADHVGLIVEDTGYFFKIIEGNMSDKVGYRTYGKGSRFIRGFALPDYSAQAEDDNLVVPEPVTDGTYTVTFHVLSYGAGMGDKKKLKEQVRSVQRDLKALGFDIGRYGTDGEFGNDTREAVKKYQRSVGQEATGVVDQKMMERLMGVRV